MTRMCSTDIWHPRSMDASCIQFERRTMPPRSSQSECTPQSHYKIYCFIRLRRNRIRGGERGRRRRTDCISVVCLPFVVAVLLLFLLSPFQTVRWSPTTAKEISGFAGRVLVPPSLHKTFRFACSTIICVQIARSRSDENNSPLYNEGKEGGGWEMGSGGLIFTPSITSLSPPFPGMPACLPNITVEPDRRDAPCSGGADFQRPSITNSS